VHKRTDFSRSREYAADGASRRVTRRGTKRGETKRIPAGLALGNEGEKMLGLIAAVFIILWLLGFFAFHVTAAFIHVALVVGLILLVLHFMRRTASV
jgi:Flp pilus assembly protein TadB